MATYIITYDLSQPGRNYDDLYKRIKSYDGWAKITDSSWVVITEQTAVQIRDHIRPSLDNNDKIFVNKLALPAAWYGLNKDISEWLHKFL